MSSAAPTSLGRYVIEGELGRGAMGVVYRARDPRIDRPVALKTLSPAFSTATGAGTLKERFLNEGRAAGRLSHRGIVAVYDADEDPATGIAFLAMELVEGTDLRQLMKAGAPLSRLAEILCEVADALDHAHARGVIHRDVKPANVLVDGEGRAHLTDFGIARLGDSTLTQDGEFLGTPAYMAPEQVRSRPVTPQTDVYALGVILYECLTGRRPFEGDSMIATATAIATEPVRPPSSLARVPVAFDAVVERALAKEPTDRHASAGAFAADLRRALGAETLTARVAPGTTVPSAPATPRAAAAPRRDARRVVLAVAAVAILAAVVVGVLSLRGSEGEADAAGKVASDAGSAGGGTAARPKPAPVTGTLAVEARSPERGTLTVTDSGRTLGRIALEGKRDGLKLEASGTFPVPAGSRSLTFTFVPQDGKSLTRSLSVPVRDGDVTRVVASVGVFGRDLEVKLK